MVRVRHSPARGTGVGPCRRAGGALGWGPILALTAVLGTVATDSTHEVESLGVIASCTHLPAMCAPFTMHSSTIEACARVVEAPCCFPFVCLCQIPVWLGLGYGHVPKLMQQLLI